VFDHLYKRAVKLTQVNYCGVSCGKCVAQRVGKLFPGQSGIPDFGSSVKNRCCNGCKYLTKDGCSVEALYCRIWTCGAAHQYMFSKGMLDIAHKLEEIKRIGDIYSLMTYRCSKEETIKSALSHIDFSKKFS